MNDRQCDILIVGGGVGGVAAALASCENSFDVVLTDEYRWIGGQLTSQGVPPDEHPWIEKHPPTRLYRDFRNRVRRSYERSYRLAADVIGTAFNPGGGFVSGLCHDPRIAHDVLLEMADSYLADGTLTILKKVRPVAAEVVDRVIRSVQFCDCRDATKFSVSAKIVLDCTELGDLLPLTSTEYVSGAESHSETGELHAVDNADPEEVQGLTWCFAAGYDPEGSHIIDKPATYDFWRSYRPGLNPPWPGDLLSWTAVSPVTLAPRRFDLFKQPEQPYSSLWNYRKIVSPDFLNTPENEVTLVNWPQNDYFLTNIIDKERDFAVQALEESKQLSLCLMYWMQTEAPRPDGGVGFPGLYLAPDILGTSDGFAIAPYIRESRRIRALTTVTEAHVGTQMRQELGKGIAHQFKDSVGVGCYRIDLHPTPTGKNYIDISSLPFQIPLGALIPQETRNLIAGNKNIGVTHITNGCYRLHPVEWNIGESAGRLAAFCLRHRLDPRSVNSSENRAEQFQAEVEGAGTMVRWPDEIARTPR